MLSLQMPRSHLTWNKVHREYIRITDHQVPTGTIRWHRRTDVKTWKLHKTWRLLKSSTLSLYEHWKEERYGLMSVRATAQEEKFDIHKYIRNRWDALGTLWWGQETCIMGWCRKCLTSRNPTSCIEVGVSHGWQDPSRKGAPNTVQYIIAGYKMHAGTWVHWEEQPSDKSGVQDHLCCIWIRSGIHIYWCNLSSTALAEFGKMCSHAMPYFAILCQQTHGLFTLKYS